jgi:hypothetical protein
LQSSGIYKIDSAVEVCDATFKSDAPLIARFSRTFLAYICELGLPSHRDRAFVLEPESCFRTIKSTEHMAIPSSDEFVKKRFNFRSSDTSKPELKCHDARPRGRRDGSQYMERSPDEWPESLMFHVACGHKFTKPK